jgi:predicted HAD superfamily Cof-like phosphohydrolase
VPATSYKMVRDLHEAIGHPISDELKQLDDDRLRLRLRLITEEVGELLGALVGHDEADQKVLNEHMRTMADELFHHKKLFGRESDMIKVADGAVDSHVVISGACVEMGIPEDAVYRVIHKSNLAKASGPTRADGKKLKPKGWKKPDIKKVLGL